MLTLINTNLMRPPIAPIGLDYIAGAVRRAGHAVELVDLCLADDPAQTLAAHFASNAPRLVGLSFRNVDDCFWPSGKSFVPTLRGQVASIRALTDAPIVLGGVGFSIFAARLVDELGVEFGIHGDGETALPALLDRLDDGGSLGDVPGLIWRRGGALVVNQPAWPAAISLPSERDAVDNATYFRRGGQLGLETKRGCPRRCIYCADPLAKGPRQRLRDPAEVADEAEALLRQGIDVLHLCDGEFNLPRRHALDVCAELIRRGLGDRIRWYAYLTVVPFDAELARQMRRAGCVGINFTADAANADMLSTYGHPHTADDLANCVRCCRHERIAVMLDMLLGGPGETPQTVAETIDGFRRIDPDCAGAALGIRVYPGTPMERVIKAAGPIDDNPSLRRHYDGPIDLLRPTFFIAADLGPRPAELIRELIGDDRRFFPPAVETTTAGPTEEHNYSDNRPLTAAIANGARGAYWDILRRL